MEYNFYKKKIETTGTIYSLVDSKCEVLKNFDFTLKNNFLLQKIIDSIKDGKTKPKGQESIWGAKLVRASCSYLQ